ncbi:polysaccharide biosynthesis/export family protein [Poriferisphaera corsica]|uniref:polysaccharide biosynthesis/export family protein n=1 Tax=Poriferisphaera corsica TaxID=2528020 RepID=UPI00190954C5|nr:polysaccharide biosynthesis/export family protein [Poriferisphaera corsica]
MQIALLGVVALVTLLSGCETDSFFNPAVVGRWEHTPVTLPILERLEVIEGEDTSSLAVTSVRPEDLIPDVREYVIGPGDLLTVTVFELVSPGLESVQTRRVDETGLIRLPIIGPVRAANLSSSELEKEIAIVLENKNILRNATVSVILQESRQNTFSVVGEPLQGGTAIGTYVIPKPDFRLLDAIALARGAPGRTKRLRIFRQTPLTAEVAGEIQPAQTSPENQPVAPAPSNPSKLIDELLEGIDESDAQAPSAPVSSKAPAAIEGGLDSSTNSPQWVFAGGKWVKVNQPVAGGATGDQIAETDELGELITQRIIEIPYDRLLDGDLRYNIVIRRGDIIRVPDPTAGFVYIMGEIARPGAYTVPGERDLTIKQLVASAGGLSQLAIPERVDLTRRIEDSEEATIRINVRSIFEGSEPDLYLKPNDLINVGTNFVATPLAIFRNGFRMTYGFGFILDRNFGPDVFGPVDTTSN